MPPEKHKLDELRIDRTAARRSSLPVVLLLLVVVVAAAGTGAAWWLNRPANQVVKTVLVQESVSGGDTTVLNSSGYVTARREATVSSKVTGMVTEVLVEEGMTVEEGQVLAKIDSSNLERSLALAEAQLQSTREALEETKVNLVQAEREYKRFEQLVAEGVASRSEYDQMESNAKSLRARLDRQQADIEVGDREIGLWKQQLDDLIIRAPFAGVVTAKNAQPGEMISLMSSGGGFTRTGICTIVDMNSLEIEVDVSESYINRVQSGQPVEATLDSYPDWRIPAKVIAIIPTADRQKATVKVRVGFDQLDPRILPEMSVKVAFRNACEAKPAARSIAIPRAAVQQRDGRDVVWIVREGRVERRAVTLGEVFGDAVTVSGGLAGGERIVLEGPETLKEGDKVTETQA